MWIVRLVQGMYANEQSHVHICEGYSEEFEVKIGVYKDSVLSLLLFIIVLEALPRKFRSGVPWEDLYTSDLVIIAESFEECVRRLLTWKEAMEEKGQRKCRKDKNHDLWYGSGPPAVFRRVSCAVCRTGVGRNRIFCNGCKHWVHKKCSGIKCLAKDPDYRCTQCQGITCVLDSRPHREVQVGADKPEMVASFYCLGDMLSAANGCEL